MLEPIEGIDQETLTEIMNMTWSCIWGGPKHCGVCPKCLERKAKFAASGIEDKTEYAE